MDKTQHQTPVIVDLGKRKRKAIKDLKRGKGALLLEVEDAITHARSALPEGEQKAVIPVVVLYRKKRKKRGGGGAFPFSPLNPFGMLRC